MRNSLLEVVRALLERTYRMRSGLADLSPFIIGDEGFRLLYGAETLVERAEAGAGGGARTLLRATDDGLRACIYYPNVMIRRLERFPPQQGLHEENVDAFADLVEELDHLLLVAERSSERRSVSLLELELHANVSKYLVLSRFLAGRASRLSAARRRWLLHHLFDKLQYRAEDRQILQRYRDAARWALRFIRRMATIEPAERIAALRGFHRATLQQKFRLIRSVGEQRLGA
jgi:hypothetical protein